MKETRYVLCDCCGNKIYLGSEIFEFDGYCGIYCSAECYADAHATVRILDEDEAENCGCDIFDDNTLELRKNLSYGEKIGFKTKEECQKFCDWLNERINN